MKEVTCILTSSGRFDLLQRTLESFFLHNTYDIKEFFICDDSGKNVPVELKEKYPFIIWIVPFQLHNQIGSLDQLWSSVRTEYVFCMEDDWETIEPGFIEASMEILERYKEVIQVWLQPIEQNNQHPVVWVDEKHGILKHEPNLWSGFRFNPSLKRKADYDLIAPFSKHTIFDRNKPWKAEADIAKVYWSKGFKAAILSKQYIKHIGEFRHVS